MNSVHLASASPRRLTLLESIGVACRVAPVNIDEPPHAAEPAETYVCRMAEEKTLAGWRVAPQAVVLGADTALSFEGRILGKPRDEEDARGMLLMLSDRTHQVVSAVAVAGPLGLIQSCVVSDVTFASLSEEQINAYLATGEGNDKAGGYAIQGLAAVFVRHLHGSYSAVVGLPLCETAELLTRQGVAVWQTRTAH